MKKIKTGFYFGLILIIFYGVISLFLRNSDVFYTLVFGNDEIISSKRTNETMKKIMNVVINKDSKNPLTLLSYNYSKYNGEAKKVSTNTIDKENKERLPLIYIYNTHDKESYVNPNKELYNIDANVKTAAYILQDQLKLYNINAVVEEKSPTNAVSLNNGEYEDTYKYSRNYFIEAKEKYPSIKYFIDLHRDGVNKDVSTVIINGKSYAKLMFFLGLGHEGSEQNKQLVKDLESIISKDYATLLRTTFIRPYDSYNQDLSPNSFLIEVGGNNNTIEEVYYSLTILAQALSTYIGEHND